jgi:drug/metabolite transporter (DMT)-like permease
VTILLLALGAAAFYGTADFLGGSAARRATTYSVLLVSLASGLAVLFVAAVAIPSPLDPASAAWGLVAGLAGTVGLFLFYGALARGPMSVVAPVSALVSAVLPVGVGVLRGDRLSAAVTAGVILCMVAIVLVSVEPDGQRAVPIDEPIDEPTDTGAGRGVAASAPASAGDGAAETGATETELAHDSWTRVADRLRQGPVLAVAAGACFGIFFVLLREAGQSGTVWPLATAKLAGLGVVLAALPLIGARLEPWSALRERTTAWIALGAGVLDSGANALYLLATRAGMLSLAAVLTALYPAITVLLARVIFSEHLRLVQRIGLVVAALGVALVTVG